ncbi:hypothetical protein OSB04_023535 [Centaurea solstitialis]|uniref:Reverse transcriptase Ty1/copia-type domain-containing protein n=1 Tax=Centaurea solstitialis TaxID=347529 RepID=A0AA38SRX0_9ASTR|nr:hypothetical protein OSB04_023535 [Centaurea solstitialis]
MNMVRSILVEKRIPKSFWPEVVNWSVYVLSPTSAVKGMSPQEAWSGIKPSLIAINLEWGENEEKYATENDTEEDMTEITESGDGNARYIDINMKLYENRKVEKYKAHLVAKGCAQELVVDYTKVFAPVERMDIVRMMVALCSSKRLDNPPTRCKVDIFYTGSYMKRFLLISLEAMSRKITCKKYTS